ncbi:MAG: peptidase M23 [Alteromonadaceae bacterium]|nr:MAG: peptidase M23 [Alteromonadaceae bacterium]
MNQTLKAINILITLIGLASCASPHKSVAVTDTKQPPSKSRSFHIVSKGETLYSIAWRYNIDIGTIALNNGITSKYTIYPGQKLNLKKTLKTKKTAPRIKKVSKVADSNAKIKHPAPARAPRTKPNTRSINKTKGLTKKTPPVPTQNPKHWVWPAKGKVVGKFRPNASFNKGIDIQGQMGESVKAASAGTVVYSGEGLRGYGRLVIIKHSDRYLSAYAHNSRLLVKEGASVKMGQAIARMGSSGTDSVKLHFEIRNDGKPVDPLKFLPKR